MKMEFQTVTRVKLPPQHNIADVLGFDPLSLFILAKGLGLQCQLHNLLIVVIWWLLTCLTLFFRCFTTLSLWHHSFVRNFNIYQALGDVGHNEVRNCQWQGHFATIGHMVNQFVDPVLSSSETWSEGVSNQLNELQLKKMYSLKIVVLASAKFVFSKVLCLESSSF